MNGEQVAPEPANLATPRKAETAQWAGSKSGRVANLGSKRDSSNVPGRAQ